MDAAVGARCRIIDRQVEPREHRARREVCGEGAIDPSVARRGVGHPQIGAGMGSGSGERQPCPHKSAPHRRGEVVFLKARGE